MPTNSSVDGSEGQGDYFRVDLSQGGAVSANFGIGDDVVEFFNSGAITQVRLSFTSSEVGNGNASDGNTMANQDGGLAVRAQAEDGSGALTGFTSRYDDEGISFISNGSFTFDIRDLVSGVARGDQFSIARLGTSAADLFDEGPSIRATYINAGMGDDMVYGGLANDFLVGGAGNDELVGRAGNDSFIGGGGNDMIFGGVGDDTAIFNVGTDGIDTVVLGEGSDTVNVAAAVGTSQVRLQFTSSEVGNANQNDSNTMANQDGGLAVRLTAEDGTGALTGGTSRYDDEGISFVSTGAFTFQVQDLVSGVTRGDQFKVARLGTEAADSFNEGTSVLATYINAGMGDDTIVGGAANDFLVGGAGNDIVNGGDGNDSFIGGGGNDRVIGGRGADTAIYNISTDGADAINLGGDYDTVSLATAAGVAQVRLTFTSAEVGNGTINDAGTLANQDGSLAVRIQAEDATGALTGSVGRSDDEGISFVSSGAATFDVRDLVAGVSRGDQFQVARLGTAARDVFDEGASVRATYINAGMGNDSVTGGTANDFLVGGAGDDILNGAAGNDSFIGGAGNDFVYGGLGDDTAILNVSTDGADTINLGVGSDTVNVATAAGVSQVRLTFTSGEVGNSNGFDSNTQANQDGRFAVRIQAEDATGNVAGSLSRSDDESISFVSTGAATFDVRDLVSGTARGDQFQVVRLGTAQGDTFDEGASTRATYINAGGGNDMVKGGTGEDFLVGNVGNDTLDGGDGDDSLLGGMGADLFAFSGNPQGFDTILDFVSGTDKIDLSDFGITADNVFTLSDGTDTTVFLDSDADGFSDFGIILTNVATDPAPGDYVF